MPVNVSLEVALTVLDIASIERDPVVLLQLVSKLNGLVLLYSSEAFAQSFNLV